jgi:hypothetical protein
MNHRKKQLSVRLLALAAAFAIAPMQAAWAGPGPGPGPAAKAPALGAASSFSILAGTNYTCTGGAVTGEVGVSPGTFTNTGCTFGGKTPPASNGDAAHARNDFLKAYTGLEAIKQCIAVTGTLAAQNLAPGVYCLDTAEKTGTLTLTGPKSGVWVFLGDAALSGTNFTVVMAGGGSACNVFWSPDAGMTMTTSALQGNILAGNAIGGSITLTGGTLNGRALAYDSVTTTGTIVTLPAGCPK